MGLDVDDDSRQAGESIMKNAVGRFQQQLITFAPITGVLTSKSRPSVQIQRISSNPRKRAGAGIPVDEEQTSKTRRVEPRISEPEPIGSYESFNGLAQSSSISGAPLTVIPGPREHLNGPNPVAVCSTEITLPIEQHQTEQSSGLTHANSYPNGLGDYPLTSSNQQGSLIPGEAITSLRILCG